MNGQASSVDYLLRACTGCIVDAIGGITPVYVSGDCIEAGRRSMLHDAKSPAVVDISLEFLLNPRVSVTFR